MADDTATVAYAWVLDGVSTIFVTDEALDTAWAAASSFVDTHVGLQLPTGLAARVELRRGYPEQTFATISVKDIDDSLAALFGANRFDSTDLVTTLEPDVTAPASLWSKHVGVEAIGAAGQRRQFSCVPGFNVGLLHYGQNAAFANEVGAAPVADGPRIWEGRRCCMYRVKYVDGAWQDLAAAKRIWWGSLRGGGTHHMKMWKFACLGPESWLGGNLGVGNFQEGLRVLPVLTLIEDGLAGEAVMRGDLFVWRLDDFNELRHTYVRVQDPDGTDIDNYLSGASSYSDITTAINSFLDDLVTSTDQDVDPFNKHGNDIFYDVGKGSDGITIKWYRGDSTSEGDPYIDSDDEPADRTVAALRLIMHEKVWKAIGYDVRLQNSDRDPVENEEQYGQFEPAVLGPGYWAGFFYSANPTAMKAFETQDFETDVIQNDYSSGGGARRWPPLYPNGTGTFDGTAGQEFQLITADEVRLVGSKSRPLMADPDDEASAFTLSAGVGAVTDQGLMVFDGLYRRRGDEDQVDPIQGYAFEVERERREGRTIQVARVGWRSTSGLVSTDTDNAARFVVYEWLEPRLFGFDYAKFDGTWGGFRDPPPNASSIIARPLSVWEYSDEGDKVTTVLQRIMLTTGTGEKWYSEPGFVTEIFGVGNDDAHFNVGDNDSGGTIPKDAESATLGLGIPASMVADPDDFAALDAVVGADLSRCKAVIVGVASSKHLFETLLSPTGMAIGYSGGKFGVFDAWTFPTPAAAVATITPEYYAGKPAKDPASTIPTQRLRQWQAIDKVRIEGRVEPLSREYSTTIERGSSDFGTTYRAQQITHRVRGDHLIEPKLSVAGGNWEADIPPRWRQAFEWWGASSSTFEVPMHVEDGIDIWPQDGLLVTDPWLSDTTGAYGVSVAVARVLERSYSAKDETITFKVMLAAESEFRMYAPSAVVTEYDETDPFILKCQDDHFGDRGGGFDVDGFAEPSWSTEGGDADIELFRFDGSTWVGGTYGVVSSVNGATSNSSITLTGALTGLTWLPDHHYVVVLREFVNQSAAWVKRWHAPICESDGTHDPASTPGSKWRGI